MDNREKRDLEVPQRARRELRIGFPRIKENYRVEKVSYGRRNEWIVRSIEPLESLEEQKGSLESDSQESMDNTRLRVL